MLTTETETSLDRLYRLQEVLITISRLTEKLGKTPDHLVHVEAAYRDFVKKRDEAVKGLGVGEVRKRALDSEIADLVEKLKKYQGQLVSVKTNKEYSALLNEIDGVKREIRTREDELLNVDETMAPLKTEVDEKKGISEAEEQSYEEQMAEWRGEQARLNEEILKAQASAADLRKAIDKKLIGTFDRIAKTRHGVGLSRVTLVAAQIAACSSCNVRLRPQLLSDLRLSKEAIYCESCKRILYWDPATVLG